MRFQFLALWPLVVSLSSATVHWTGDSACTELICVNATLQTDRIHYQVTNIFSSDTGYIGLGFGDYMTNTPLVVLWPSSNGSTIVSQRFTMKHREPRPVDNPPFLASPSASLSSTWPAHNLTTMAFTIPVDTNFFSDLTAVHMVWSFGRHHPDPQDDPDARLFIHYHTGRFTLNMTRELDDEHINLPPEESNLSVIIILHGLLGSLGFLLLLPAGSLIARYARSFTVGWFPLHKLCNMYIAGSFIVLGWLFGPISVVRRNSQHFRDTHQIFGYFLILAYVGQVLLGLYIHKRRAKGLVTVPHPPLNILHVASGLCIMALAFAQVYSGLHKLDILSGEQSPWTHKLFNVWIIMVPLLYLAGLVFVPRQFKQEKVVLMERELSTTLRDPSEDPLLDGEQEDLDPEVSHVPKSNLATP